ncbi:Fe-S cluster assembly protein SufD [Panacagrimonas sp.]|uniref:Fe-S cluster assembly protein SufD n=1 Tax=Panacagrimonas sp. TaxID=2480088 RepID=UPI003B526BC6
MQTLQTYADAYLRLPAPAQTAARHAALDRLLSLGLPTRAEEDWKYTDLSSLHQLDPLAGAAPMQATTLPARSDGDGVDALNAAFACGGLDLRIGRDHEHGKIVHAVGAGHRRHRIRVETGASALIRVETDPAAAFQTVVLELDLAPGASAQLLRLQQCRPEDHRITRIHARVARDAQLDIATLDLGGRLSRHDVRVDLAEAGAQATVRGLFCIDGQGHVDNYTRIDHHAVHGTSRELYRGLASDRGRGIFRGAVVVHPGAQKTDSEQRVASLLLSPGAEIDAKPELEIYADDVKCAHGNSFGQLDPAALFYLQTRGLPVDQARALLTLAFALEPLRQIPHAGFRDEAVRRVASYLGATEVGEQETASATEEHG